MMMSFCLFVCLFVITWTHLWQKEENQTRTWWLSRCPGWYNGRNCQVKLFLQ